MENVRYRPYSRSSRLNNCRIAALMPLMVALTLIPANFFPSLRAGAALAASTTQPGAVGVEQAMPRRQAWRVPSPVPGLLMQAELYRPAGNGPFPLAVINHGSEEDAGARARMAMPAFPALTDWLVAKGYAVLVPERAGHGVTGGPYLESQGWCGAPDYRKAGLGTAASIDTAMQYMLEQSFIRKGGVLVVGNSAGGWGALALAAENDPAVAGVVNFAGGRGGRDHNVAGNNCAPDRLVAAAAEFGQTARVPTLWLYAKNDSYFPPDLSRRMSSAFASTGGRVDYQLLPPVRGDGHALIETAGKEASWAPVLARFLDGLHRRR